MKKLYTIFACLLAATTLSVTAQQLPDPGFEDWSDSFNGDAQPKYWHGSNVEQVGFKFTFLYQKDGRSGKCAYVADKEVGAMGITEVGPGYFGLGTAWSYLEGLSTGTATAGTYGGINFTYRPDTMSVWIKRTGSNTDKEDFHLLFYSWTGTAKGSKYKNKNGGCTSVSQTNEESDIRQALDGNECGTDTKANQVAEGWIHTRAQYNDWVNIKVPIYYMNSDAPTMCNVIFSAGNYPNFRANSGLYKDNGLWVDDVQLIYSSEIQSLVIDGKEWKGFDPTSSEEQTYSLGEKATTLPTIEAWRGAGTLKNVAGTSANFPGRKLQGSEITITNGVIDGTPTTITVKAGDGSSTHTYKIKFVRAASTNANLAGIKVNGEDLAEFKKTTTSYDVKLPYGTTKAPVVEAILAEDAQTVVYSQASSVTGKATITVTAADKKTTKAYTLNFSVAELSDNTLKSIKVNGAEIAGFTPTLTIYKVSLPIGTTTMPTVEAVSAYPAGAQTIKYTAPDKIDGGTYQISVTTPGNSTAKVYKLNFKLEASSYSYLKSLKVGNYIADFDPQQFLYYVNLPLGTASLPTIEYEPGDAYQTVSVSNGGVNGTSRVTVTAANGDQTIYKIVVATQQSEYSKLNMIYLDGQPLAGFDKDVTTYDNELAIGTTALPNITVDKGDEYETYTVLSGGLNGTTRISVSAQNGNTTIYQINFSVKVSTDNSLRMIYINGTELTGFDKDVLEYTVNLPKNSKMPTVTFDEGEYQTITVRDGGLSGEYKITVRPQTGASKTYKIRWAVETSDNTQLSMIYVNGNQLENYSPDNLEYTYMLQPGEGIKITYDKEEEMQKVLIVDDGDIQMVIVTAESGRKDTCFITFETQKNSNAKLAMIYLVNGNDTAELAGFDPEQQDYHYTLTTPTSPRILVASEVGQQVTISTPVSVGTAQIRVQPESGSFGLYRIFFEAESAESAELTKVFLDGKEFEDFKPEQKSYTIASKVAEVTWETEADTVESLRAKDEVILYVVKGSAKSVYTFTFTNPKSTIATVDSVFFNGVRYEAFNAAEANYTVNLAAGEAIPTITFYKSANTKETYFGQVADHQWEIKVIPEDGDANTYSFTFVNAKYNDAVLENLELSNGALQFESDKFAYSLELERGAQLPDVVITTKPGQTTLLTQTDADHQQLIVTAEDGSEQTYIIAYTRTISNNTKLANIYIDSLALAGFAPDVTNYVDSLAWRTRVVPCVRPVGQVSTQVITTYYCAVNGTMRINVQAESGDENDYYIEFPVRKSANVELESMYFGSDEAVVEYKPNVTFYDVVLPYQSTSIPSLVVNKAEPEQTVEVISRPLGDTTEVIVYAENGIDTRTYKLYCHAEEAEEANRLAALRVKIDNNDELEQEFSLKDKTKRNFELSVPYGSRTLKVEYEKMFPEQTVFVQPGGVHHPTVITVKANRGEEADEIYTITPVLGDKNPAVITVLTLNGDTLKNFNPYNYSYIIPVENKHIIRYAVNKGAEINILEQNEKHWQAEVTYGNISNIYDLWFYYKNDVLPNPEFNQWESGAYHGDKPKGWNTLGNLYDKWKNWKGTFTTGEEVVKESASVVKLHSKYNTLPLMGYVPGYITLGTINAEFSDYAGSDFSVSGGITFRNSPDQLQVNYKQTKISNNKSRIVYQINGSLGTQEEIFINTTTQSEFVTATLDLRAKNAAAGVPQSMNIILNSFESEGGKNGTEAGEAIMFVDWARFSFNHTLASMNVDAFNASKNGNAFSATLTDPERIELPVLSFTGEVEDQAQTVTWDANETNKEEDGIYYGIRNASIVNYAENGTDKTNYTLKVRRPLDTRNTLSAIKIGGAEWNLFVPETNEYEYHLKSTQKQLPDFEPVPASSLQSITMSYADSTMTIIVAPEHGDTRTYKVKFITDLSDDVTLKALSDVTDFDKDVKEYTIDAATFPVFNFTKQQDGQVVRVKDGIITITAENGSTTGTYTVKLKENDDPTSAQLSEIEFDGDVISLGNANYSLTENLRPNIILFKRADATDTVVFTQRETGLTWHVLGNKAEHTYTLTYPTTTSSDATLSTILVNGEPLAGFSINDYTIKTDTAVAIQAVGKPGLNQSIAVNPSNGNHSIGHAIRRATAGGAPVTDYNIVVTAEDGSTKTYPVKIVPVASDIATLNSIKLNGVEIDGFRPDSFTYEITLPTPTAKLEEPQMPSFTYEAGDNKQTIEVTIGELNKEDVKFFVSAADGDPNHKKEYLITVNSEPSHNAELTGIMVNGVPVEEFEVGRHNYSANAPTDDIEITWAAEDNFQTVKVDTLLTDYGARYLLNVTAQDGVSKDRYDVKVYVQALSNDADLADILLDGKPFNRFLPDLNPNLVFDPSGAIYTINLESGTTTTPEISATMKVEGQTVKLNQNKMTVYLDVTAGDGVTTKRYTLNFEAPKSKNANLSMIYIGTDSLDVYTQGEVLFVADEYYYHVNLPVGVHSLPEVVGQKGQSGQKVINPTSFDGNRATIIVKPEDETASQAKYTVVFDYTLSAVDVLNDLTADGITIQGFKPDKFFYNLALPAGTTAFPELDWEQGDNWQTVKLDTIKTDSIEVGILDKLTRQITVKAENGQGNVYTVIYEIEESNVDTLTMIYVDNKPVPNFKSRTYDYYFTLEATATSLPEVFYAQGDIYQSVTISQVEEVSSEVLPDSVKAVNQKIELHVRAQNGSTRIYTIHFSMMKSNDATLNMIQVNGKNLNDFISDQMYYRGDPLMCNQSVPVVTFAKRHEAQIGDISIFNGEESDTVQIKVTAEDGKATETYRIVFAPAVSENFFLGNLIFSDGYHVQFDSLQSEYELEIPYGIDTVPAITAIPAEDCQTINIDTVNFLDRNTAVQHVTVLPYNNTMENVYTITYRFRRRGDSDLKSIAINNEPLTGFKPENHEYSIVFPAETESKDYYRPKNVTYTLSDTLATDTIWMDEHFTIYIEVTAQDGTRGTYSIAQSTGLSDDNTVLDILLDSVSYREFDPDVYFYTYYIAAGGTAPQVDAIAGHEKAEISVTKGQVGDTIQVICTAENGDTRIYSIWFRYTTIDDAQTPESQDVLVKRLFGSTQILVASLRSGVQFYLYDRNGHIAEFVQQLPVCDQNDAIVTVNANGQETLIDVVDPKSGVVLTLAPNTIYFYGFYETEGRRISSGKLIIVNGQGVAQ